MRKDVPGYLSLCDHSVFFIRPTYSKMSSSPTKQAELMGMGIPVVCNDGVGDTGDLVEKYKSGIAIKDFTTEDYTSAVKRIGNGSFDRAHIREGAFEYFSLSEGVKKYAGIYESICR